jgi:hypothetical protein
MGGGGGWEPKISRDIQLLSEAGLRGNRAVGYAENESRLSHIDSRLPHIDRALADQSGADEVAALEADAVMLRKLPAGSRAFVERQRRARALNAGDEPSPLRDLGRMYSMCITECVLCLSLSLSLSLSLMCTLSLSLSCYS